MKKFKLFFSIALSAGLILTACSDDDDNEPAVTGNTTTLPAAGPTQNIAEIAIADVGRSDSLVVALAHAREVGTFQNAGTFTVFAPTNQAFIDLLATNNAWNKITDIPAATLKDVLYYHVLNTVVKSTDLTEDTYAITLNNVQVSAGVSENNVIEVDLMGGAKLNNEANITAVDIEATNGVIHFIDKVLMTRNVVQLALNDERFTSLVAALTAYPSFTYTTTLSGNGPFTIFAPTNDAFQALLDGNQAWNTLADIDSVTLSTVLTYHVVAGSNVQAKNLPSITGPVTTLNGDTINFDLTNGAKINTTSGQAVDIIVTDVQGNNGVIHAVNQVLLPN